MEEPAQTADAPVITPTAGIGFTVIVSVVVAVPHVETV
jgi:hypothetical protein